MALLGDIKLATGADRPVQWQHSTCPDSTRGPATLLRGSTKYSYLTLCMSDKWCTLKELTINSSKVAANANFEFGLGPTQWHQRKTST